MVMLLSLNSVAQTSAAFKRWYRFVRIPLLVTFTFLLLGIINNFTTIATVIWIKFPSYYTNDTCDVGLGWDADGGILGAVKTNPNALTEFWAYCLMIPYILVLVLLAGYGMISPDGAADSAAADDASVPTAAAVRDLVKAAQALEKALAGSQNKAFM